MALPTIPESERHQQQTTPVQPGQLRGRTAMSKEVMKLEQRITDYLSAGGLVNPELADHVAVRDLLIDCREALANYNPTSDHCMMENAQGDLERIRLVQTGVGIGKPEQPAQQEPVAKVCHDLDGHIGWNPNLRQLPDEGTALYAAPPAQRPHECSRSHPHENMDAMCELRTEIARLTNENARLKALHQDDEINTYRMTLLCIRDGLQQGMSKSIQKLQAREINDVMGLPSFASYRTSPPAQRKPLTDEEIIKCWGQVSGTRYGYVAFARAIEAAHGIKEKNT